ncbi:MAG: hypothetical protein HY271_18475 [Deltaproteobacteria bacterium]|nr:hypothetical protein [Deltaproteobacteria bacterium]
MAARVEALRTAGQEALRAAGVADDATAPARVMPFAGRSVELDLAIVERLARAPDPEHAAALRTLEGAAERAGWKAVVKEARRALYRFGQRGVAVPEAARVETPRRPASSSLEGYLSAIDGRGDRLVWLVRPRREGGLLVLTAILNEPTGLRDVSIAELPRKTLRRMERDLQARHHLRLVPADGAYCDALLAEGFTRARATGAAGVGEYPTYRARLTTAEPAPRDPPLAARVLDATEVESAALAGGVALLDEPEFTTWRLERPALAAHLADVAAARESPLVLSRPQQEERVRDVVARAMRELFGGESGVAYRRRLEEMAYYLQATGRRAHALVAWRTACALAASTAASAGIPFFEELTRRSFAVLLEEDAARARDEAKGSVLVRPGAAPAGTPRIRAPR